MGRRRACGAVRPLVATEVDAGLPRTWSLERGVDLQRSGRAVQIGQQHPRGEVSVTGDDEAMPGRLERDLVRDLVRLQGQPSDRSGGAS